MGDEIILSDCDEDMMNGPFTVKEIDEDHQITLEGTGSNAGITCVILGEE